MDSGRRATLAALVGILGATFLVPGTGHVYLREWRRAAAWLLAGIASLVGLLALFGEVGSTTGSVEALPLPVLVPYLALLALSVVDAYRLAQRRAPDRGGLPGPLGGDAADDGRTCPECNRSVDPEMNFCWYCSTALDERAG